MKLRHALALAGLLLLAGCAPRLHSTLVEGAAAAAPDPVPTEPIAPAGLEAARAGLCSRLDALVAAQEGPVPLQLVLSTDGSLRLRAGSDESFVPDSAQLRPEALAAYEAVARLLKNERSTVAHVLVHSDIATDADPALDLTARRAASLQSVLLALGAPGERLRAEGRGATEPATDDAGATAANRRIEVVFQPVVAGQEPQAWTPPAPVPCGCGS